MELSDTRTPVTTMRNADLPNARAIAAYVTKSARLKLPDEIVDQARKCLVDWFAVALGGIGAPGATTVWQVVRGWHSHGKALMLLGGRAAPPLAALVNGTLAHTLDFDDTYDDAATHFSAPIWAAALALGAELGASEASMLKAFVTGFEVGARLGDGFGGPVTDHGWHATGVFGRLSAVAACASLLELNSAQVSSALGVAATQVSGLVASFGTMSKPFHVGRAAMDGILSAQLAANGFAGADDLLEEKAGLAAALVQDASSGIGRIDFSDGWRITKNTFKPYAACMLTHASIDAARGLTRKIGNRRIVKVLAEVNPLAVKLAGRADPTNPTEAKFSVGFTVALALTGHDVGASDFSEAMINNSAVREIVHRVELKAAADLSRIAARLAVTVEGGDTIKTDVAVARGNPQNPITWDDLRRKFDGLVEPVIRARTSELFAALRSYGGGCRRAILDEIIESSRGDGFVVAT